jgi:hypothetical protein
MAKTGISDKTVSDLIKGLAVNPAFLLIFGLAFLYLTTVALVGAEQLRTITYVALPALLLSAVVVVYLQTQKQHPTVAPPPQNSEIKTGISNTKIDLSIRIIIENLTKALSIQNEVVSEEIDDQMTTLKSMSKSWADHTLSVPKDRYESVLLKLYIEAKVKVACTSVSEYLPVWRTYTGDRVLEAHKKSSAPVQRVFILQNPKEAEEAITVLQKQDDEGIDVRLFFLDSGSNAQIFQPPLSNDFTVIDDGEAVGVTLKFASGELEAKWIFGKDQNDPYVKKMKRIIENSIRFNDYLENRRDPIIHELYFISDNKSTKFVESSWPQANIRKGAFAVIAQPHDSWQKADDKFSELRTADWIAHDYHITNEEAIKGGWYKFLRDFMVPCSKADIQVADIILLVDDECVLKINGHEYPKVRGYRENIHSFNLLPYVVEGKNKLEFLIYNDSFEQQNDPNVNPIFANATEKWVHNPYGIKYMCSIKYQQ